MATTAISVREYLSTVWRPDRDYVNGEVLERNLGEQEHALFQIYLAAWFFNHRQEWRVVPLTEQRVQVSPSNFRIPDVCLREESDPFERILHRPPLLCIEIMSREDRLALVRERAKDYVQMGVTNVWIIDPHKRRADVFVDGKFEEFTGDTLRVANTDIHVPLADLWAELDR
jgi:Uma2 family endonuclease